MDMDIYMYTRVYGILKIYDVRHEISCAGIRDGYALDATIARAYLSKIIS